MRELFEDVIPPKARKYVYLVVAVAAIVIGAIQTTQGDWKAVTAAIITALVNAMAAGNTNQKTLDSDGARGV